MISTHRFYCRILIVLLLSVCLLWTVACNNADGANESSATTALSTNPPSILPNYYSSDYVERTSWDIKLSVIEIQQEWIVIQIRDNDNLGFVWNKAYLLERLDGDTWTPVIFNTQKELTAYDGYTMPAEGRDYITTNTEVINPQEPGHYRVTKYLSDHPVTLEFEIS